LPPRLRPEVLWSPGRSGRVPQGVALTRCGSWRGRQLVHRRSVQAAEVRGERRLCGRERPRDWPRRPSRAGCPGAGGRPPRASSRDRNGRNRHRVATERIAVMSLVPLERVLMSSLVGPRARASRTSGRKRRESDHDRVSSVNEIDFVTDRPGATYAEHEGAA